MHVRVKPTLTRTKSDPNDPDNPDDPTRLQRWYGYLVYCLCMIQRAGQNVTVCCGLV